MGNFYDNFGASGTELDCNLDQVIENLLIKFVVNANHKRNLRARQFVLIRVKNTILYFDSDIFHLQCFLKGSQLLYDECLK